MNGAYERRNQLKALSKEWTKRAEIAAERLPRWGRLQELVERGGGIPSLEMAEEQIGAVQTGRKLLEDPDPLGPLMAATCGALRNALASAHARYHTAFEQAQEVLGADSQWVKLESEKQQVILGKVGLREVPPPKVDTEEELLESVRAVSLSEWDDRAAAIQARVMQARELAAKELAPKATRYSPPPATLETPDHVEDYVSVVHDDLLNRIQEGPVII